MTTVEQIVALLEPSGLNRGRALHMLRAANRPGAGSENLRQFLRDYTAASAEPVKVPAHPAQRATVAQYRRDRDDELSAVELAWLQRLPQDPSRVTFEQATQLAALSNSVNSMKAPASARLVASVWGPVKVLHDRRVTEARLEQARQPLPEIPASVVDAVTEVLATQHPDVSTSALSHQSVEILTEASTRRQDHWSKTVRSLEQDLASADERAARQNSMNDEVA